MLNGVCCNPVQKFIFIVPKFSGNVLALVVALRLAYPILFNSDAAQLFVNDTKPPFSINNPGLLDSIIPFDPAIAMDVLITPPASRMAFK